MFIRNFAFLLFIVAIADGASFNWLKAPVEAAICTTALRICLYIALALSQAGLEGTEDATDAPAPEVALLPLRLIATQLSRQGDLGWRFGFPRELMPIAGIGPSDTVYLISVQGFLEVWTISYVRANLALHAQKSQ